MEGSTHFPSIEDSCILVPYYDQSRPAYSSGALGKPKANSGLSFRTSLDFIQLPRGLESGGYTTFVLHYP